MKKLVFVLPVLLSILGCESMLLDKTGDDVQEKIANQEFVPQQDAAIYVKSPELYQEVKLSNDPAWMELPTAPIQSSGSLPLSFVMNKVLGNNGINYIFSDDIKDPNMGISVNLRGRIKDALEDISHVTGLSYTVVGNTVNWSSYITETFNVSYIPGDYSYMLGSSVQATTTTTSGSAEQMQFGGQGQEYSNVKSTEIDAFAEITKVTNQIVGEYGSVAASTATSSVIVTTTKARMDLVRSYFKAVEMKLGRQIAFEIKILRFTSNLGGKIGIDWNLVKQDGDNSLIFNGGNFSSLVSGSPITFSATKTGGEYNGSSLLVSALEKQGTVSITSNSRVMAQPNRVAELELSELQAYIASTEVTPSANLTSSEPTVALKQGVVESGYRLYAIANIGDQDKIILHLSTTYIPKPVIERKEVESSAIEAPNLLRNRNVSTVVLRNGETMMFAGLQLEASNKEAESPLSARMLPTRKSRNSTTTETIALVSPVIVDMN